MLTPSVAFHHPPRDALTEAFFAFPRIPGAADVQRTVQLHDLPPQARTAVNAYLDDADAVAEWTEEDVVWLHWRLLLELRRLPDPGTPLEEKFDTLAWALTDPALDDRPFSFANCLRVVGTSPLSPTPYFGRLQVDEIREWIRAHSSEWLRATIARYPQWVQAEILEHPEWAAKQLAKNPQWVNEQIKMHTEAPQGDLFGACDDAPLVAQEA